MRTGYMPTGPIQYPPLGSLVSKELGDEDAALPNFVSIAPYRFFNPAAYGPGFLGPQYAPLIVGDNDQLRPAQAQRSYEQALKVQDLDLPADVDQRTRRRPPRICSTRWRATSSPSTPASPPLSHQDRLSTGPSR